MSRQWTLATQLLISLYTAVSPFYLGGATGEDPLAATGIFSESMDLLLPKPTTLSVAAEDPVPTMQPPSYHDLFPGTIGENNM